MSQRFGLRRATSNGLWNLAITRQLHNDGTLFDSRKGHGWSVGQQLSDSVEVFGTRVMIGADGANDLNYEKDRNE